MNQILTELSIGKRYYYHQSVEVKMPFIFSIVELILNDD